MARFIGDIPGRLQKLDSGLPFGMGQLHILRKACRWWARLCITSRIRGSVSSPKYFMKIGDVVGCDVAHAVFLDVGRRFDESKP